MMDICLDKKKKKKAVLVTWEMCCSKVSWVEFGRMMMSSVCLQPGFYSNKTAAVGGGDGAGRDVVNMASIQSYQATVQQAFLPA